MPKDEKLALKKQKGLRVAYNEWDGPPLTEPAFTEWCKRNAWWLDKVDAERAEVMAANAAELDAKSLAFPAVAAPVVTLSKSLSDATLIVRPWVRRTETDYRTMEETRAKSLFDVHLPRSLVITGLGPHRGRRKRRGVVDVIAMGFRGELSETGVTCDGNMGLPDIATHLRLRLNDLKATVVVTTTLGWVPMPAEWLPAKAYVEPKERDPYV